MPYGEPVDLHATAIADLLPCGKDERVCFWLCPSRHTSTLQNAAANQHSIDIAGKACHRIDCRLGLFGCVALGFLGQLVWAVKFQHSDRFDFRQ